MLLLSCKWNLIHSFRGELLHPIALPTFGSTIHQCQPLHQHQIAACAATGLICFCLPICCHLFPTGSFAPLIWLYSACATIAVILVTTSAWYSVILHCWSACVTTSPLLSLVWLILLYFIAIFFWTFFFLHFLWYNSLLHNCFADYPWNIFSVTPLFWWLPLSFIWSTVKLVIVGIVFICTTFYVVFVIFFVLLFVSQCLHIRTLLLPHVSQMTTQGEFWFNIYLSCFWHMAYWFRSGWSHD